MSSKPTRVGARALAPLPAKQIRIGGFTLTATGMLVHGRPSWGTYQGAGDFITRACSASGFWLSDWLAYGESRADWTDRLSQAQAVVGLNYHTLENIRAVGRSVPISRRRETLEFGHHEAVAAQEATAQTAWLERAEAEGWTCRELRQAIRQDAKRVAAEGHHRGAHEVEVTILVSLEAANPYEAEQWAWSRLKAHVGLADPGLWLSAQVIAAHARPT